MKKIISLAMACVMTLSMIPTALATTDYQNGTLVEYKATGSESYTITVPAQLAPGKSGDVTLSGTWADNRIVTVTADPTVTLTNSIKTSDQKVLNVTFDGISEAGSNTGTQTFTKNVAVADIENALFGTWSGKFNYNVEIVDAVIAGYSYNGHILPQIPVSDECPYAYMFTLEGELLNKTLENYGFAEYVGQVDVAYNLHLSTHPYTYEVGNRFSTQEVGAKTIGYGILSTADGWFIGESNTVENGGSYGIPDSTDCQFVWCNTDLVNTDGSIFLAASDPVPVYEQPVEMISFTIKTIYSDTIIECQAEKGMTWEQWVVSDYNTANVEVSKMGDVVLDGMQLENPDAYYVTVQSDHVILDGASYIKSDSTAIT